MDIHTDRQRECQANQQDQKHNIPGEGNKQFQGAILGYKKDKKSHLHASIHLL